MRIYHRTEGPEAFRNLMMIRNNDLYAQILCQSDLLAIGDTAVHGNDQTCSVLCDLSDGLLIEPISLLQPVGDVTGGRDPKT